MSIADDSLFFCTGLRLFRKLQNWSHRAIHILWLKRSLGHKSEARCYMENSIINFVFFCPTLFPWQLFHHLKSFCESSIWYVLKCCLSAAIVMIIILKSIIGYIDAFIYHNIDFKGFPVCTLRCLKRYQLYCDRWIKYEHKRENIDLVHGSCLREK